MIVVTIACPTPQNSRKLGPFINESGNVKCQWVLALTTSKITLNKTSYFIECLTVFCFVTLNILFSDDICSIVRQLDYSNPQNIIPQVKTCLESWKRHILYSKKYILRSHLVGHLCHNINRFASHLVDTIYWVINIPTNRITYNCEFNSVTHVTKLKEAFGIYIDERGSIKYQMSMGTCIDSV